MKVTFPLVIAIAAVAATETQTVTAEPSMAAYPNGHAYGCLPGNVSAKLPFCNASLTVSERLEDLVGRLTLDEKIGLLAADSATKVSSCNMMDHGVPRLGIPAYMHLVETNTA